MPTRRKTIGKFHRCPAPTTRERAPQAAQKRESLILPLSLVPYDKVGVFVLACYVHVDLPLLSLQRRKKERDGGGQLVNE
jgi:hypothetical protein